MLSQRGQDFLASLERRPSVPTAQVEAILAAAGVVNPAWLDFHQRYAGYVLDLGRDIAVLGLVFDAAEWFEPGEPRFFRVQHTGEIWGIACADAHPSYEYVLTVEGQFQGGLAESFDVFVEQSACLWWFRSRGKVRLCKISTIQDDEFRARLLERPTLQPVPEASDQFTRVLMDDEYLVFDDPREDRLSEVWERPA